MGKKKDLNRITGLNKETGEAVDLMSGSRLVVPSAQRCPWVFADAELNWADSYETPQLISLNPTLGMCQTEKPVRAELKVDGHLRKVTFRDQEMTLIPCGDVGQWTVPDPHGTFLVSIHKNLFVDIAIDSGFAGSFDFAFTAPFDDPYIRAAMIAMRDEMKAGYSFGSMYGDQLSLGIAAHLLSKYNRSRRNAKELRGGLESGVLKSVIDLIKTNLDREISISELSKIAGFSPFYFSRMFKASTGMSPYQYVTHCRLMRAQELSRTIGSSKEIATAVGFSETRLLNKHFNRLYGKSPFEE